MTASRRAGFTGASQVWAVSSAGEHYVDIVGVTSSILVPPTIYSDFASQKHSLQWSEFRNKLCLTTSRRAAAPVGRAKPDARSVAVWL